MEECSVLPDDVLQLIANKLHLFEDYVRFGAVCRSWHQIFLQRNQSSYPMLPWLMLREKVSSNFREFYSPFSGKVFEIQLPVIRGKRCWGSLHGWLVTIGKDVDMHLLNPFSRVQIPLPPLVNSPNLNKVFLFLSQFIEGFVHKAVLSASPYSSDCVIMAIYSVDGRLALTRPGFVVWSPVDYVTEPIVDIIYYNCQFFAAERWGRVLIFNVTGFLIKTLEPIQLMNDVDAIVFHDKYIVEFKGEIYMVIQCFQHLTTIHGAPLWRTMDFVVYMLDLCAEKAERMDSLDDWSVFVGHNYSFSICASDYPEIRKNCVYFTDKNICCTGQTSYDMGIYCFEDREIERYPVGRDSVPLSAPPLWITPSFDMNVGNVV